MIAIIPAGALIILIMQIIIKAKTRSKPDTKRGKKQCPENVQKSQASFSICSETRKIYAKNVKCLTGRNILASFYLILWNPFKTSLFLQLSRIGSQGTTRGTKKENAWHVENPSIFYWILWCRFRTSLFPPGSRMGYQGTTKGATKENVWQVGKPYQVFLGFCEVLSRLHFFYHYPGWDPKKQPEGPKRKMLDRWKNPSNFLLNLMRSFQDTTFSTRIQDGVPRDNQRDQKGNCLTLRKTRASFYWILWNPSKQKTSSFCIGMSESCTKE